MPNEAPTPEWKLRQAHHDATQPIWEGPAHRGRVWNDECRAALAKTGHTSMGYVNCACRAKARRPTPEQYKKAREVADGLWRSAATTQNPKPVPESWASSVAQALAEEGAGPEEEHPETRRYRLALESLTPGGSEFVKDPEACVRFVRERRAAQKRAAFNAIKRQRAAEQERDALRAALEEEIERLGHDGNTPGCVKCVMVNRLRALTPGAAGQPSSDTSC